MTINSIYYRHNTDVSGVYRIRFPRLNKIARNGSPYISLEIGDMSGSLKSYIWTDKYKGPRDLVDNDRVAISGRLRYFDSHWITVIHTLERSEEFVDDTISLIPFWWCPIDGTIPRLHQLVAEIRNNALRKFLQRIFSDDAIAYPFVSLPGSISHHHNFAGGLLSHSLECAEFVKSMPLLSAETKELGIVAALLHDIGKIRTISINSRLSRCGFVLSHDALTLEIMGHYLRFLDEEWSDGATALRYLWTWKSYRHRSSPLMTIAEAVNAADRLSAGFDRERSVFSNLPAWRNASGSNLSTGFWRPRAFVETGAEATRSSIAR